MCMMMLRNMACDQGSKDHPPSSPSPQSHKLEHHHHMDINYDDCQGGEATTYSDSDNFGLAHCQLSHMPVISGDSYCGSSGSEECHGVNRDHHAGITDDCCKRVGVVIRKKQWKRCRQVKPMRIMNTLPLVILMHMMGVLICTTSIGMMCGNHLVDAFGFSSLPSKNHGVGKIPMMQQQAVAKSSLFMSTKSDSSATTTSTTSQNDINPAATPNTSSSSTNEYSFFDEAIIYIRAGSGGQGSSTYRKGVNNQNGPPDGGNGGKGGNVILEMDDSLNTLAGLARYAWRPNSFGGGGGAKKRSGGGSGDGSGGEGTTTRVLSFRAENGVDGKRHSKQGRNGKDVVVRVPPGTVVQEEIMSEDGSDEPIYVDVGTVNTFNPTLLAAYAGEGGEGSSAQKHQRGVRQTRTPPQGGERKRLKLTLKVVADVALVAVPNAGKSTLLSKVTRAKPKIADYPFTTVVPNLGVWVPSGNLAYNNENGDEDNEESSKSLIMCDVPGLIAGASEGIGLGHAFLRHVERCHVILHILDATSKDVLEEYAMINRELINYGTGKLATMPQVVIVNKIDVAFDEDGSESGKFRNKAELEEELKKVLPHSRLMWISALEEEGVDDLMERVAMFVKKVKGAIAEEERRKRMKEMEEEEDDDTLYS